MSSRASSVTTSKSSAAPAPMAPPAAPSTTMPAPYAVPYESIAMRAYEKWRQRGCPAGTEQQDWYEAEAELKAEMAKGKARGKTGK